MVSEDYDARGERRPTAHWVATQRLCSTFGCTNYAAIAIEERGHKSIYCKRHARDAYPDACLELKGDL